MLVVAWDEELAGISRTRYQEGKFQVMDNSGQKKWVGFKQKRYFKIKQREQDVRSKIMERHELHYGQPITRQTKFDHPDENDDEIGN